jgi:hypothetical protein
MLKMNSACTIQCAAIDPHLFKDGGRIGGNQFRLRLDEVPSCGGLVICFTAQCGEALAYACNNNYYVNSSGHVLHSPACGQEHEKRTAERRDGSVSFRSIAAGPARTTTAWR